MAEPTTVLTLTKPISAHDATLTELTLREPTVAELRRAGSPYKGGQGNVQPDFSACAALISEVCGIPPSSVDQMKAADFNRAAMILVGFTVGGTDEVIGAIASPPS